ncbi:MAG: serine hydrolase, partial [Candidatus Thorarchaeota archaeon]|nr:serine hydrolase [Candidatus Thorarchaeota archaeon]
MKHSRITTLAILVVVVSTTLLSQSITPITIHENFKNDYLTSQNSIDIWPTNEWQVSTPEEQGMDSSKLDDAMEYIVDNDVRCDGLVVIRNGYIVYEEYPRSRYNSFTLHRLYSTTKSVLSALVGIALDNGNISSLDT